MGKFVGNIGGREPDRGIEGAEVTGVSVPVDSAGRGFVRRDSLGEQGGDDATENIAHAGAGHSGVAILVEVERLAGRSDDAMGALEDDSFGERIDGLDNGSEPVGLDGFRTSAKEATHFTGMRGENGF